MEKFPGTTRNITLICLDHVGNMEFTLRVGNGDIRFSSLHPEIRNQYFLCLRIIANGIGNSRGLKNRDDGAVQAPGSHDHNVSPGNILEKLVIDIHLIGKIDDNPVHRVAP